MTKLIIFSGLPGTGKSTLSWMLARELKFPLICIDDVIGEIPENAGFSFWDSRIAILMDVVEKQTKLGLDVIVDSVFMNTDRHHAQALARKYNARFLPVYVYVSDENTWRERVTNRFNDLDNPDVATWERIQHQRQHFRAWDPGTALFVDNARPLEQNFEHVIRFVTKEDAILQPLEDIPLTKGKYHV
jgi:predicted kinase